MLLYYITDRTAFPGGCSRQRESLLRRIAEAAQAGIDYIQLREKDLLPRELEELARDARRAVRDNSPAAKLLINGRADIALAVGADGVHLPGGDLPASEVRSLWRASCAGEPVIGVSAHSLADVRCAADQGADFAVLAPIFEKVQTGGAGIGLEVLHAACIGLPLSGDAGAAPPLRFNVLALGGVTLFNAAACMDAGAGGIAGIRIFQQDDIRETVRRLRML